PRPRPRRPREQRARRGDLRRGRRGQLRQPRRAAAAAAPPGRQLRARSQGRGVLRRALPGLVRDLRPDAGPVRRRPAPPALAGGGRLTVRPDRQPHTTGETAVIWPTTTTSPAAPASP